MAAENSGGRVNYYLVRVDHPQREDQPPYQAECEDIIHALGMTFDEGNIFKEVWRQAAARQGRAKEGNTALRGAQKLVHYANRILRAVTRITEETTPTAKWIEWDGLSHRPSDVTEGTLVEYITAGGIQQKDNARNLIWDYRKVPDNMKDARILRYRKV